MKETSTIQHSTPNVEGRARSESAPGRTPPQRSNSARSESGPGANQVLTTQAPPEVGTARRAVRGRLGEATLPKPDLRPIAPYLRRSALNVECSMFAFFLRLDTEFFGSPSRRCVPHSHHPSASGTLSRKSVLPPRRPNCSEAVAPLSFSSGEYTRPRVLPSAPSPMAVFPEKNAVGEAPPPAREGACAPRRRAHRNPLPFDGRVRVRAPRSRRGNEAESLACHPSTASSRRRLRSFPFCTLHSALIVSQ